MSADTGTRGAAKTYTIRTVADFLLVPEDRLGECLREFRIMLDMARATTDLLGHVADEMARQGELKCAPGDVRFQLLDRFEWIDDDAGNVTMRILSPLSSEERSHGERP